MGLSRTARRYLAEAGEVARNERQRISSDHTVKELFFLFHNRSGATGSPTEISDERAGGLERQGYDTRSKSSAPKPSRDAPPTSNNRSRATLTKQEIARAVYSACPRISRRQAKELIDAVLEEIVSTLVAGEDVKLRGFGNFAVRQKRERPGRNPKTGVVAPITARRVVTFKGSENLKVEIDEE
jgi:integration host factor subunit alpha